MTAAVYVSLLQLKVRFEKQFERYASFGDPKSAYYVANAGQRAEIRKAYLEANPQFREAKTKVKGWVLVSQPCVRRGYQTNPYDADNRGNAGSILPQDIAVKHKESAGQRERKA